MKSDETIYPAAWTKKFNFYEVLDSFI